MGSIAKISRYYFFYGVDEYSKMKKIKSLVDLVIVKGFSQVSDGVCVVVR